MASLDCASCMDKLPKPRRAFVRPTYKRTHSSSPQGPKVKSPQRPIGKKLPERRCQSLSPSSQNVEKKSVENVMYTQSSVSTPENDRNQRCKNSSIEKLRRFSDNKQQHHHDEKEVILPHCVIQKLQRTLSTKKRELLKLKKNLLSSQTAFLELFANIKDLENRIGVQNEEESVGDIRIVSVAGWPANDLLMLIRESGTVPPVSEMAGVIGPQILQQLQDELASIPDEFFRICSELLAKRIDVINIMRTRQRPDRGAYNHNNHMSWKVKLAELDHETENLHRQLAQTAENLVVKINFSAELAKKPWHDRESLIKKNEKLQKEIAMLQDKVDSLMKQLTESPKSLEQSPELVAAHVSACNELQKERATRENLKDVVRTAEDMLRAARTKISTLERQIKDLRAELEQSKRKCKDLEQLIRHKESNYDARSRKLIEVSKTGEMTIEALSRQRDALELRVKELREQTEAVTKAARDKESEQRSRADSLQAKAIEQERARELAEARVASFEAKVKNLEEQLLVLRDKSAKLIEAEKESCLDYTPAKENEPTEQETNLYKELQSTRAALNQAEEELMRSRKDKDSFLDSLSRLAQGETNGKLEHKMATELLERELKISKMQHIIDDLRENEKLMEDTMTKYEDQLADLRVEVKRLRHYDCYSKDIPYEELQTELLDLHQKVQSLTRERAALVSAAASRALMLERHERSADLFARMTRLRRDLEGLLEGRQEQPANGTQDCAETTRSLSSLCMSAAETWSALRAERARVLSLERTVFNQNIHIEQKERVRTQLEKRRAFLERQVLQSRMAITSSFGVDPGVLVEHASVIPTFNY